MKETLKIILEAIKYKFDEVVARFPKKLSELENDLQVVQADWNQNDENAPDYIKNKPFYTSQVETFIVEETIFTLEDGIVEVPIGLITSTKPLEIGKEYIIILDGVTYNCMCKSEYNLNAVYIGNLALLGVPIDTGESFLITPLDPRSNTELAILVNNDVLEHTVSILDIVLESHQLDEKYIPDSFKSAINQSAGLKTDGNVYTINDKEVIAGVGAEIFNYYGKDDFYNVENIASGDYSHAEGYNTRAYGECSHAEGRYTIAVGNYSHVEGQNTAASGNYSHAEGGTTLASGNYSHSEGWGSEQLQINLALTGDANSTVYKANKDYSQIKVGRVLNHNGTHAIITSYDKSTLTITTDITLDKTKPLTGGYNASILLGLAYGEGSHTEGGNTTATGECAHSEGIATIAYGRYSHAEGSNTIASSAIQHVQGKYNIEDIEDKYAHIVGNGTSDTARSNAHALDWKGNAWFAGSVEGTALILLSPNGTRFNITIGDDGVLTATEIAE